MKKLFFSGLILLILALAPRIVSAEANTLPDAVDNIITLEEDTTLLDKLTITNNTKINLNNHTLKLTQADNHFNAEVTIENGTIDISGVSHTGDGIIEVGNYGDTTGSLIFNNITLKGESYGSSYAVIYVYGTSKLDINNCAMNFSNENSSTGGVIKSQGTSSEINVINSTLNFTNTVRGFLDGTVLIKDSEVTITSTKSGGLDNAINTTSGGLALTLDNSILNISNATGRGITLDNTALNIKNSSNIRISNCNEGEIYVKTSGIINIDNKSYIDAVISQNTEATGTVSVLGGIFKSPVDDKFLAEGYVCKKMDYGYIVVKEHDISVSQNINGGTISLSQNKAFVGDTITVTVTANEWFEVEKIELIGLDTNSRQTIENNKFTMPDEPVEVKVLFKEFTQEVELPTINKTEEFKEVIVGIENSSETEKVLIETLMSNNELRDLSKANNIKVEIGINPIEVSSEDEKKINETLVKISKNINILKYLDISIYVKNKDTDTNLTTLSTLNDNIKFTVALPSELKQAEENNYYVVRVHNGTVEVLNTSLSEDGNFLEFESKYFSTYAIAYGVKESISDNEQAGKPDDSESSDNVNDNEDQVENTNTNNSQLQNTSTDNKTNSLNTGDNILFYVFIFIISIVGLFAIIRFKKSKD